MSGIRDKAIQLLGDGTKPVQVASALGVSESYISQLLTQDKEFMAKVAELRFTNLANASARDGKYDAMEDKLLERMEELIPWLQKPREVLAAIAVINNAKRRGQTGSAGGGVGEVGTRVTLSLPTVIQNNFITNVQNQVISVGNRELSTINAGVLNTRLQELKQRELTRQLTASINERNEGGTNENVHAGSRGEVNVSEQVAA